MKPAASSPHTDRDALKRAAAEAAVQLVENDMIVGLGSGSTTAFAVEALARRQRQGLRFVGIPTSERTAARAKAANIPLTSFSEHRQIDLTIDGADEVERGTLNLIKGLGGALLREKIVAEELAARLGWPFEEGDMLHPESNVAKMHAGIPLTDADRLPWLERVADWIDGQRAKKQPGIVTCSALKRAYRQIIIGDRLVRLVYLRGGWDLIAEHLEGRHGHLMPAALLQSQIDTLEEPDPSEDPLTVDVGAPVAQVADEIIRLLGASATVAQGVPTHTN